MSELANTGGTRGFAGMDACWDEDLQAFRTEQASLYSQLDAMLSFHMHRTFLEPYLQSLHVWLSARVEAQQVDLPACRRVGATAIRVRGDDLLEGMCITAGMGLKEGYLPEHMERYFLSQVRPAWTAIANRGALRAVHHIPNTDIPTPTPKE